MASTLNVTGASTLSSTLEVSNAATMKSTLNVSKAAVLESTLTVNGITTLVNDLSMNGNLNLDGNLSILGNLTVTKQDNTTVINTTVNEYQLIVTEDISLNGDLKVSGDASFNQAVDINGKLSHKGLVLTSGTEIDQIKSVTTSLTPVANVWTDTGISGTDLTTGIYFLSFTIDDNTSGGTHYNETYTGTVSWYDGNTDNSESDEIYLHRSGKNPGNGTIYLRTIRTPNNGQLKLQIYSNISLTSSYDYVFKFRRFI
jgi:cytoskeletal protein CcmA (bactofilin family)